MTLFQILNRRALHPVCAMLLASLAACGGGGGSAGTPAPVAQPVVSSTSVSAVRYSQAAVVTVQGSNLDAGLTVTSAGCKGLTLSSTAPYVSTASTAYYKCTVSAVGAQSFSVARSDGTLLGSASYSVEVPQVTMTVSNGAGAGVSGSYVITLEPTKAPVTVDNFLAYVNAAWYDGTIFHRHAPGFVLQAGAYPQGLSLTNVPLQKASYAPIALEVGKGLSNVQYTVAMARTDVLNSATSQFFINLANNSALDTASGGYAVFGTITSGSTAVTAMQAAPCTVWPAFFNFSATECLPLPNLVISSAVQTR